MENYQEQSIEQLIEQLGMAGRHPELPLMATILERREDATPFLLKVFAEGLHDDWADDDDPRWYRLVHAGQILRYWKEPKALPTFIKLYEEHDDWCEWFEEELWEYGEVAIEPFGAFLLRSAADDTVTDWEYGRALASGTLCNIALAFPETRDRVVEILSSILPPLETIPALTIDDYRAVWTTVAGDLGNLQHEESRAQVVALFDVELIDTFMFDLEWYNRKMKGEFLEPLKPYDLLTHYKKLHQGEIRREERRKEQEKREKRKEREPRYLMRGEQDTIQVQHGNKMIKKVVKVGRNEPCPCGSGKKHKKCCWNK